MPAFSITVGPPLDIRAPCGRAFPRACCPGRSCPASRAFCRRLGIGQRRVDVAIEDRERVRRQAGFRGQAVPAGHDVFRQPASFAVGTFGSSGLRSSSRSATTRILLSDITACNAA